MRTGDSTLPISPLDLRYTFLRTRRLPLASLLHGKLSAPPEAATNAIRRLCDAARGHGRFEGVRDQGPGGLLLPDGVGAVVDAE
jgi:hypothetical protein